MHDMIIEEKISDIDAEFLKTFLKITEEEYENLEDLPNSAERYNSFEEQAKKFRKAIIDGRTPRIYYC